MLPIIILIICLLICSLLTRSTKEIQYNYPLDKVVVRTPDELLRNKRAIIYDELEEGVYKGEELKHLMDIWNPKDGIAFVIPKNYMMVAHNSWTNRFYTYYSQDSPIFFENKEIDAIDIMKTPYSMDHLNRLIEHSMKKLLSN